MRRYSKPLNSKLVGWKFPTFLAEFKLEAANLVLQQGYSIPEAARALDIGETAVRRWVTQLQGEHSGSAPKSKAHA
tara:strand:- start:370 stop:597 length:228 start_codon:yes stop_codon:yes gene_type:complete